MDIIEFPGLGLSFTVDRVAFYIFGFPVYWYGVIIAFGFMLAVILALKDCPKFGISKDTLIDILLYATPVAIVTSRLFYVAFSWKDFKDDWKAIFDIRSGGLAIYGAIIGAFLVGYIYARVKKINIPMLFDFAAPYFPLAQAIGRWGNFVNQEAYGTPTDLPWGMTGTNIKNGPVHPTFLYESLWNIAVFFILIWYRKKKRNNGEVLFLYMILYGLGRSWIELLRSDSLMIGNLRANFLLAVLFVIIFGILFIWQRTKDVAEAVEVGQSEYGRILRELSEMEEDNILKSSVESPENVPDEENEESVDKKGGTCEDVTDGATFAEEQEGAVEKEEQNEEEEKAENQPVE